MKIVEDNKEDMQKKIDEDRIWGKQRGKKCLACVC